jgi:hypothetical protein
LEVLGVSLLWDGICKEINLGPDVESETHPSEQQETLMMPPPDVEALPLPHMEAAKPSPVIEGFDWLTGHWDEQIQPTNPFLNDSDVIHTATNPFLTWDPFASELASGPPPTGGSGAPQQPKSTNSPSTLVSRAAIGDYVEIAKKKFGSDPGNTLTFQGAMELDIWRLNLGLSAAQRDHALLSLGRDPASIDPNKLLNPTYLFQVCI